MKKLYVDMILERDVTESELQELLALVDGVRIAPNPSTMSILYTSVDGAEEILKRLGIKTSDTLVITIQQDH